MTRLFLFSHQDDEIGVIHSLAASIAAGSRVLCVYLTDGAFAGVTAERRKTESLEVLSRIGVPRSDIHFLGDELGIPDGRLVEHLDTAFDRTMMIARANPDITAVIMHAWEGGHHDHDAAHLLGRAVASALELETSSRQFPLYRASPDGKRLVYATLHPSQGAIDTVEFSHVDGLRRLWLLRLYRSQARVMLQLSPHIMRAWLIDRRERLQALPQIDVKSRPAEHLLYERWKFYTFEQFRTAAKPFVDRHLTSIGTPISFRATGAR